MIIYEFGKGNQKTIVLIHPSMVMWDYFEYVIPLMKDKYHLIIPALPGYDTKQRGDFTSIEQIVAKLEDWLKANEYAKIECIYGCSMGGSIVTKILANGKIKVNHAVVDGGITPYQLPWVITRFIAVKDFLMISMGKIGGLKILEKAFATDEYSKEDLQYVAKVMKMVSYKTIWRTFDSCNNYSMPSSIDIDCNSIEYWYTDKEEKKRRLDIKYFKENIPQTTFRQFKNVGHAGLATLHPQMFVDGIEAICSR